MNRTELEVRKCGLEVEVIKMLDGSVPFDEAKVRELHEINKTLNDIDNSDNITLDSIANDLRSGNEIQTAVLQKYLGFCISELGRITERYATAEANYCKKLLESSKGVTSSAARIIAQATPEYEEKLKSEELKSYVKELVQTLKKLLQSKFEEWQSGGGIGGHQV